MPAWLIQLLAGVGIPLIGGLLQGTPDPVKQTTTSTPTGYQSPLLGAMDPLVASMLSQNMKRFSQAGFGAGGGLDTSMADSLMAMIAKNYPSILEGLGGTGTGHNRTSVSEGGIVRRA